MEAGSWIGNIWGTYKGLGYLEITNGEGTQLTVLHTPAGAAREVEASFTFDRVTNSSLDGQWVQADGNAGVFTFERKANGPAPNVPAIEPLEVVQRTIQFPKITIYRDEIVQLIAVMKTLLPTTNEVVVHIIRGQIDIKRLAVHFWGDPALPERVDLLELSLVEANPAGIVKTINLVLGPHGCSMSVSGGDRVWVDGGLSQLRDLLRRYHSIWRKLYERHGLNLNGFLALMVLTLLPSLDLLSRSVFVAIATVLVLSFWFLHRWTTQLRIFLKTEREKVRLLDRTDFITTILGAALLAAIPYVYTWLKGQGLTTALSWLASLTTKSGP